MTKRQWRPSVNMPKQISDTQDATTRPAPFDLPLMGDYGDGIIDRQGALMITLAGDSDDPKTVAQRDYVVRAVNSYEDMLAALKAVFAQMREQFVPASNVLPEDCEDVEYCTTYRMVESAIKKAGEL